MFLHHYALRENPFGVTPDPRFLYKSQTHREAFASLVVGTKSGIGFQALVAQPGMGKTTLLFNLLEDFRGVARTAFLFQTQCDSRELLRYLLSELGEHPEGQDIVEMHQKLNEILLVEFRAGRRVLVVIDEAQNLDIAVLETVRLLSDFETARNKLLQIIIAGQPQLAEKLARPELTQLRQRISILGRLTPLGRQDVEAYVQHRLTVAGYRGPTLFTPEALEILATCSQGIPRNINTFCFNALSAACALERHTIDAGIVREVIDDLSATPMTSGGFSSRFSHMDSASCAPSTSASPIESALAGPKDAALKALVEEVRVVTGATGVAIGLKHGREIVCQAASGETVPGLGISLDCDSGFSGECVRTGRVLHCSDTKTDPLIDANRCDQLGIRSVIAVPLHRQQEVVGLIEIFSTQPGVFDEEDIGHLQRLAKIVVCLTNGAERGGTGLRRSRSGGFARTCR